MNSPTFLDCTLRDGGYYTAWDFSPPLVDNYLKTVSKLPISTIELGYCNLPRDGYYGQYYFLDTATVEHARGLLRPDQRLGIMLDEKAVPLDAVDRVVRGVKGSVDLVRMAVAPDRLQHAANLGQRLRELGFDVAINVMYLSKYWNAVASLPGLDSAAEVSSCIALVDSYGACTPEQVRSAIASLRKLHPHTPAGFHGHDNMRLAVANSLSAIEAGAEIIDTTVTGMGRGPGNAQTETLLVHQYRDRPDELDYEALHNIVDPFEDLRKTYAWGTNLVYMISGASALPQNRVMDWLGKNRYSVPSIIRAMRETSEISVDSNEFPEFPGPIFDQAGEIIIVGGGPSVKQHMDAIKRYATKADATVIHANYRHLALVHEIHTKQYVALVGDVADRLPPEDQLSNCDGFVVPASPRIKAVPEFALTRTLQVAPFFDSKVVDTLGPVSDIGPLALALGAAIKHGAKKVTLVGFDGYENATPAQQEIARETQQIIDAFQLAFPSLDVASATRTRYELPVASVYSRLADLEGRRE